MTPARTIAVQDWMRDPGLVAVMNALGPEQALMVGGAVRAALMGVAAADVDIATPHTPQEATRRLEAAGLRVVPTGIDHGTVTAVSGHKGFEVTTLRRDVETDGRRAVVAYTEDWVEDAQRRDFTMNTLLMDLEGHVFDPTGQGIADLDNGAVRFVGDPATRIAEDALRILRFFRFHALYGKGDPDAAARAACQESRGNIENLSRERVTHEVERLLPAPRAAETIAVMISDNILPGVFQKNFNQKAYRCLQSMVETGRFPLTSMMLFAYSVWENRIEDVSAKIERFFVLSNAKKSYLKNCIEFHYQHTESIRKNLYLFGQEITLAGTILYSVINDSCKDVAALERMGEEIMQTAVPVLPVGARDVMQAFDMPQGKSVGDLLGKIEDWWLQNDTVPDKRACLDYAKGQL